MKLPVLTLVLTVAATCAAEAAGRPMTAADLQAIERISDPQVSPDGGRVVYTVGVPDLAANRIARNLWMVSVQTGVTRALTTTGRDSLGRWAPDGRRIAFVSQRDGGAQLYVMNVDEPAEPVRLTRVSGGVDNIVWSGDGQLLAFTSEVYPDCRDEACDAARDKARDEAPSRVRIYDRLLYRHWTTWSEGKRAHLFIVSSSGGPPRDLTPGADYDVPPREREGPHPIAFSPDGRALCYTAVADRVEATSTNGDLFEVSITGGEPRRLTTNPGFDGAPAYSPDGLSILYRSQARAGYESDKWRLMLYDRATGRQTSLTEAFDRSVETAVWSTDGTAIFFNAEDRGEMPVFELTLGGTAREPRAGLPHAVTAGMFDAEFDLSGQTLVVARSSLAAPAELQLVNLVTGLSKPLTHHNAPRLDGLDLARAEAFTFAGAGGTEVGGLLVRPPAFDPSRKYPVVMLLHGGPQTQWGDTWSYRWNAQLFASPGYVVVMINRRGSTGAGQKFTDEVAGDWNGKAVEDLLKGLDFVLAKYSFTDPQRLAAAGGSYGGYMVDWLASQSKGRFKALISHAGVYDLASMYGATEELWFPEHDLGGTPWTNPSAYQRMSPSSHAAEFGRFKTPTLVICGEQDYRVPYTQSLEFYTALQRQDVPSKLVVFPDEGHWILKPQNSLVWYREVHAWLAQYLR
jgi:dipeptidyl aminopeptidase/acylaminoacyl peptidase